jgi:hypothetical protein
MPRSSFRRLGIGRHGGASSLIHGDLLADTRPILSQGARSKAAPSRPPREVATAVAPAVTDTPLLGIRRDAPALKSRKRGNMADALTAASSTDSRNAALRSLHDDTYAATAHGPRASVWRSWVRLHERWFGPDVPPLPLTAMKIQAVAASLKAGGYSSFSNYSARAKAEHLATLDCHGVRWTEELRFEMARSFRSVNRGVGPGRQSHPLYVLAVGRLKFGHEAFAPMGPVNPRAFGVLGGFSLTREIEISLALASHLSLSADKREGTWNLPASKSDPHGIGEYRTWGCTCSGDSGPPTACPYHSAVEHLALLARLFATVGDPLPADLPLFPTSAGRTVSKLMAVTTIEELAIRTGAATRDCGGKALFGGHSLRTGGAQLLASHGLDQVKIQALARWKSPMLAHYAGLAPLLSITTDFRKRAGISDGGPGSVAMAPSPSMNFGDSSRILEQLVTMKRRLDELVSREAALAVDVAISSGAPASSYVCNTASHRWHVPRSGQEGMVPMFWTSRCGWAFGQTPYELRSDLPIDTPSEHICERCLPDDKAAARIHESVDVPASSCSSSSSDSA